jgi:glycosyltransferase involved in cell wall biosynthesis
LWLKLMTTINARSERRALQLVDHIFALSEYTRSQLSALVPGEKLSLGWPGVDTGLFYPLARSPDDGYILSVGRHSDPRKNLRLLLQAYRRLCQRLPNVPRLMLAGDKPSATDWTLAVELGIADHIDVRVNVTSEVLPSLYRRASLFVLASDEEGLGIVLLEAMASGLPVVSTRCGGPETCVVEGETGYLTPVGDAEALAARMQVLLEDDTLRQRLGWAGRRLAESRFSIEAAGVPFLAVYDRLLGGAGDLS